MKKVLPLIFVLIGAALLITAVIFWIDSSSSAEPQSFGQALRDWITLMAGLGASIKGWIDLVKKEPPPSPTQSNTNGGIIISGKVDTLGKDVIGRDQNITNIVSEDTAYDVEGLLNPYLGLRAFTYKDRDSYAGREQLAAEALEWLVAPGEQRNLLFVTGASGSGKSSFAQAGLLPVIITYYEQKKGFTVHYAVFRPSLNPKTRLDDAMRELGPNE